MEIATIAVEKRKAMGTNHVRKLRTTGRIPVNLYGGDQDPVSLDADYTEVKRHLDHHLRVYNLKLDDREQTSFLQHVQWDCLTDEPLHLDFRRIDLAVPLKMDIELVLLGHPKGIAKGGRMIRDVQHLRLACLPDKVPEQVEVAIGDLDVGEKLLASDISLPEGSTLDMPADQLILHVTDPNA